jgi:hypothetical protein
MRNDPEIEKLKKRAYKIGSRAQSGMPCMSEECMELVEGIEKSKDISAIYLAYQKGFIENSPHFTREE